MEFLISLLFATTAKAEAPTVSPELTIKEQVIKEFGKDSPMVKIADCESHFTQFENGKPLKSHLGTPDYGVFQINEPSWDKMAKKLNLDYKNSIKDNIEMAKVILKVQGIRAWGPSNSCHHLLDD